ncbi:MAG: hypothetical protein QM300_05390 [Pseudomonadota bacterium]|mgnify:CR=1 FL=1|jgi:hypothetical protein|nr:hypothetical protein [Pseudomonadota bacterium]
MERMIDVSKLIMSDKTCHVRMCDEPIKEVEHTKKDEKISEIQHYYRAMKTDNTLVSIEIRDKMLVVIDPVKSYREREKSYGMARIDAQDIIGIIPDIKRLYKIERSGTVDRMVELWTFFPADNYVEIQKLDDGMVTVTNIRAGQPGLFDDRETVLAVMPDGDEVTAREVTCH